MKWLKKNGSTIGLFMILLAGISLLLYPTLSDYWNSFHQTKAISGYTQMNEQIDDEEFELLWQEAEEYNKKLPDRENHWVLSEEEYELYETMLDSTGTGMMGAIEIATIDVALPIYHGTEEITLQNAVGHVEGSSLPVGGLGSHCVLSGHRGLPSAKLFTDLDKLVEGDLFLLHILNQTLTYEVDQIRIIEPYELDELEFEENMDLCTLVTCTPYGINSHRLLVRGHRIETEEAASLRVLADAIQVEPVLVAPAIAAPLLLLLLIWLLIRYRKR